MRRVLDRGLWSVVAVVAVGLAFPGVVSAAPLANFGSFGTPNGVEGGQLIFARGVAANVAGVGAPVGSVYVAEANANHRISQFTATGEWVRSWGWDVVRSGENNTGVDEQQTVTLAAGVTGGTFMLRWPAAANTTDAIAFNASAAEVQAALEEVSTIGAGNVGVTSPNPGGGASPGGPYTVTFQNALGGTDQANISTASALVGGGVTVATPVQGGGYEVCEADSSPVDVCKGGPSGVQAGQMNNPSGIAIDQTNGYLYVTSVGNRRVDVFSGSGEFAGAFGWGVDTGAAALEVCTTASGCQAAGAAGAQAGNFSDIGTAPAVDPNVPGRVYVADKGNLRVAQYSVTIADGELVGVTFDKAFGWDVVPGGDAGLESCTTATTCQAGQTTGGGNNAGQFTAGGSPSAVAVDGDGSIYATSGPLTNGTCSAAAPCRVQKFAPDASSAVDFGPASGPGQLVFTSGAANSTAALNIAVDPTNDHLYAMRRETSTTYKVLEYDSDGNHIESHPTSPLTASSMATINTGLTVGHGGLVYANSGAANSGQVFILGAVDPPEVTLAPATGVEATTATFNGTVTIPAPGAPLVTTTYRFEYSSNGIDWTSVPASGLPVGDGSPGIHAVSATATGLSPGALYTVRLAATTGSAPVTSTTMTFTTDRTAPTVRMAFVDEVTQTSAHLGAHLVAEGLPATYHFEWGATPAYGNHVPAFEREIGDGRKVVVAKEPIQGLDPRSTYHYRVVATSYCHPTGPTDTTPASQPCQTASPDQTFETLNHCGLTNNRCYEMVSPPDKGPVGAAGDSGVLGTMLTFQAAPEEPEIAYMVGYGLADATHGSEVLYQGRRDPLQGWTSWQLLPSMSGVSHFEESSDVATPLALADDLSCGIYASLLPLTEDSPTDAFADGKSLMYRRDADGTWTLITVAGPVAGTIGNVNPQLAFNVIGMGEGPTGKCHRVVATAHSSYVFPGIDVPPLVVSPTPRLYAWEGAEQTYLGVVPGPGCPEGRCLVETRPGRSVASGVIDGSTSPANHMNAVSKDGSRVFFTASRRAGIGAEVGRHAIFVHENGATVGVEASASQAVGVPNDQDARYEIASPDGNYVFFTGRYGLAGNGSSSGASTCSIGFGFFGNGPGCDLYRYGVDDGRLTNLSFPRAGVANSSGASVAGVLDVSEDGSRIYFAARGQLLTGEGKSEAANIADNTFNIYLSTDVSLSGDGTLSFVGVSRSADMGDLLTGLSARAGVSLWTSRATPDGRRLVFDTSANLLGYQSGVREAYLYDADSDTTICVSCRRDRRPAVDSGSDDIVRRLVAGGEVSNRLRPPRSITDDGRRVFFISPNRLAVGATEGRPNLYQWEEGQISFLASSAPSQTVFDLRYAGASADGDNVYFTTVDRMSWADVDSRLDVYVARVGGGFPQPPALPEPCDALAESDCLESGDVSAIGGSVQTDRDGSGNAVSPARAVVRLGGLSRAQRARLAAGRRIAVPVRVTRPGRVAVRGVATVGGLRATVLSGSRQARAAGRVRVPVSLSRAARRRIDRTGVLRVRLSVTLTGAVKPAVRGIVLVGPKPRRPGAAKQGSKTSDRGRSSMRAAGADRKAGQ